MARAQRKATASESGHGSASGAAAAAADVRFVLSFGEHEEADARLLACEVDGLSTRVRARVLGAGAEHVDRVITEVDLEEYADDVVGRLSGGQRSRASLAVALLGEPELLVLDEPTVGLDPVLREDLWTLFHRLADAGVAVFVSSHVMDEAERCDRLLLMREGRIIADGTPAEIKERAGVDDVEAAFLAIVRADRGEAS